MRAPHGKIPFPAAQADIGRAVLRRILRGKAAAHASDPVPHGRLHCGAYQTPAASIAYKQIPLTAGSKTRIQLNRSRLAAGHCEITAFSARLPLYQPAAASGNAQDSGVLLAAWICDAQPQPTKFWQPHAGVGDSQRLLQPQRQTA